MNNSVGVQFSDASATGDTLEVWAKLEQLDPPEASESATLKDTAEMVAYAEQGNNAFDYIADNCSAIMIIEGVVTIVIEFVVWVSSTDLEYTLHSTAGYINPEYTLYQKGSSFDIIFDKASSKDLGFLFGGTIDKEMPFFDSNGGDISPDPTITVVGSLVTLSTSCSTVLRANGLVEGYKHQLLIPLPEAPETKLDKDTGEEVVLIGYSVPSPKVIVDWGTGDPNEKEEGTFDSQMMEIPTCAEDLLNSCDTSSETKSNVGIDEENWYFYVYWNRCTGDVLESFWRFE